MTTDRQFKVSLKEHGRLNLPKRLREALDAHEGEDLIFQLSEDGRAEVMTAATIAKKGRGLFAHLKQLEDETADFIAERHREAGG